MILEQLGIGTAWSWDCLELGLFGVRMIWNWNILELGQFGDGTLVRRKDLMVIILDEMCHFMTPVDATIFVID